MTDEQRDTGVDGPLTAAPGGASPVQARPQCHFVSNTHWDREWRYSMQRTRHMLVYMIDMLLDIFKKEPDFKSFHMDSQSIPIEDYLEIRPEREEEIRRLVKEGRLCVGPWYVLPDEFCVGGESLIRNLLLGHRIASRFGKVTKTGYSPFSWGQISQMPQIYSGFGIPFAAFYRGINTIVSPNSEFRWQGPDGTTILASRLAKRPRYNVWYIIQRPVYWDMADENARLVHWNAGHAPFRLADAEFPDIDLRYAHPKFEYHSEHVEARAKQALAEQDGEWTTRHRFWSAGHDSSCPDIRETRMIADCREALADVADVFHSTFADFQAGVCSEAAEDLPLAKGEMRYPFTEGSSSPLFGWITSARMDIKVTNCRSERLLGGYAEPMAVFASMLGAAHPRGFLDAAWRWLLKNHGHDSIGCCSRDVVPDDMIYRFRQADEIATCVMEQAFVDIAGAIDLGDRSADDVAVVAWNALPRTRTEVAELCLDIPRDLSAADFDLVDEAGRALRIQKIETSRRNTLVQSPNDVANYMAMDRSRLYAELPDLPGAGYRTFFVRPLAAKRRLAGKSMVTRPHSMENEFLAVTIQPNGALEVTDKASRRTWRDLGYFRDTSEMGNPWQRTQVARDEMLTTLGERARIACVCEGELVTRYRVEIDWMLPKSRSEDETRRHETLVPCRIVNSVTLRAGCPWVEIASEIDNSAEDHYLQVSFPTCVDSDTVSAQTPFDVVTRDVALPDPELYAEDLQTEHPMDRFVDISDGTWGVALLNDGLKAYESHDDADRTISLTMLRCFPLRICVTNQLADYSKLDKGSQCLGRHTFRYAFMPHEGDWARGGVWQAAERFTHAVRVAQIGSGAGGHLPRTYSFLEIEPETLHLSAVKQSEDGEDWIVRLFNQTDDAVDARVRLNGGRGPAAVRSPVERIQNHMALTAEAGAHWAGAQEVSLEEIPERDLKIDGDGWVKLGIAGKRIATVRFRPRA